jgi:UDP-glucose 4-epimerase
LIGSPHLSPPSLVDYRSRLRPACHQASGDRVPCRYVATHSRQEFVDSNITGSLSLLEEAVAANVAAFIHTSTTSVFGDTLIPPAGTAAAWITEDVRPVPKNIYGVTKAAAEDLCQLFHRNEGLACIALRTSRFFPEEDDNKNARENMRTPISR